MKLKTEMMTCATGFQQKNESWYKTRKHKIHIKCRLSLYYIQRSCLRVYLNSKRFHGKGGGGSKPQILPLFPLRLLPRHEQYFETKPTGVSRRSHPGKFFSNNSQIYLFYMFENKILNLPHNWRHVSHSSLYFVVIEITWNKFGRQTYRLINHICISEEV